MVGLTHTPRLAALWALPLLVTACLDPVGLGDPDQGADAGGDLPNLDVTFDTTQDEDAAIGAEARVVTYDGGAFVQLNSVDWVENNADGAHAFLEDGRDTWSVSLADGAVRVRLDLLANAVYYSEEGDDGLLYSITAVNPESATGWSASHATFADGAFVQLTATRWVRNTTSGTEVFTAVDRDASSVYLVRDGSGDGRELNFGTLQVRGEVGDDLYPISAAEPDPIQAWEVREVVYEGGRFVQTIPGEWSQIIGDGTTVHRERDRDVWSVYMTGPNEIQFDLYLGWVLFHAVAENRTILEVH